MSALTGTGTLIRLILRRDRIVLPLWVILVGVIPMGMAASYVALYPTAQGLKDFADLSMSTPATIGMLGFIYAPTVGGLTAWRAGLNGVFLIVPISILFLIRHTRTDEEAGRRELLGGAPLGRLAPVTAALAVVSGANLLIGAIIAFGLIGQGLPAAGSLAMGLSAVFAGWIFTALAALAAQIAEAPGPARAISLAVFAIAWIMRAIGDLTAGLGWLSWASPLGWVRFTRAFAGEQWGVFGLDVILVAVLLAAAYGLCARRDLGAGLIPARPGPAEASPALNSPLALAWRLYRPTLIGWGAGTAGFGFLLGLVGYNMGGFVDAPQMRDWAARMGSHNVGDAFLFVTMYILGQVMSIYAITAVLQMGSEEREGRADTLLAAPVPRLRWALSHLFFAIVAPALLLLVMGLAVGLGYGLSAGDVAGELPRLLARTMSGLPAIWVVAGIAALFYGLLPRIAAPLTWGILGLFFALELGWELQLISQAVFNLSPYAYVHWTIQPQAGSLIALTLVAAGLCAAGLAGLRRRDIG